MRIGVQISHISQKSSSVRFETIHFLSYVQFFNFFEYNSQGIFFSSILKKTFFFCIEILILGGETKRKILAFFQKSYLTFTLYFLTNFLGGSSQTNQNHFLKKSVDFKCFGELLLKNIK